MTSKWATRWGWSINQMIFYTTNFPLKPWELFRQFGSIRFFFALWNPSGFHRSRGGGTPSQPNMGKPDMEIWLSSNCLHFQHASVFWLKIGYLVGWQSFKHQFWHHESGLMTIRNMICIFRRELSPKVAPSSSLKHHCEDWVMQRFFGFSHCWVSIFLGTLP